MILRPGILLPEDPTPIYCRSGDRINREMFKQPQDERLVKIHAEALVIDLAKNHKLVTIRSVSGYPYNCVGMIFAARRAYILIDYIYDILQHDGYRAITRDEVREGDVILYKDRGEPTHVALVLKVLETQGRGTYRNFLALSKWGDDAEFVHRDDYVAVRCGLPSEYFTERPLEQ